MDLPLVEWSCQQLLHQCEAAMYGVIVNFPHRWARITLHLILKPLGLQRDKVDDVLGSKLARMLTEPNETRTRLTRLTYRVPGAFCPLGRMEDAFHKICAVEALEKKVSQAAKEHGFKSLTFLGLIDEALNCASITASEAKQLKEAELARQAVIKVDDFADEELRRPMVDTKSRKKTSRVEMKM
jgi:acyl-CoA dehydrogenase